RDLGGVDAREEPSREPSAKRTGLRVPAAVVLGGVLLIGELGTEVAERFADRLEVPPVLVQHAADVQEHHLEVARQRRSFSAANWSGSVRSSPGSTSGVRSPWKSVDPVTTSSSRFASCR